MFYSVLQHTSPVRVEFSYNAIISTSDKMEKGQNYIKKNINRKSTLIVLLLKLVSEME